MNYSVIIFNLLKLIFFEEMKQALRNPITMYAVFENTIQVMLPQTVLEFLK